MKTVKNLCKIISIVTIILCVTSCEKTDIVTETKEIQKDDTPGFALSDQASVTKTLVLQMSFDKNVSEEDAEQRWNAAVKDYIDKHPNQNKGVSTEAFFQVITKTGSQTNNGTDAAVQASVDFNHSGGSFHTNYITLNNPGNDRQEDQKDFYLIKILFPNITISWIEAEHAHLRLQGSDTWLVKSFKVKILPEHQTIPATGKSKIVSYPNIWLGNINANATDWDYYHTGSIGTGRLNF